MNQLIIQFHNQDIVFGEWTDSLYRWVITPNGIDDQAAICISKVYDTKRFGAGFLWGDNPNSSIINDIFGVYCSCYPEGHPEFSKDQIPEAKDHIDKFLRRVNTLKTFA